MISWIDDRSVELKYCYIFSIIRLFYEKLLTCYDMIGDEQNSN
jgi:hypothetical protein